MAEFEFRCVKAERTIVKVEHNTNCFQVAWVIRNFGTRAEEVQSDYYQIARSKVQFILFWNSDETQSFLQVSFFATDVTSCGNIRIAFAQNKVISELVKLSPSSRKFLIDLKMAREEMLAYVKADDVLTVRFDIPIDFAERASTLGGAPLVQRRRMSSEFGSATKTVSFDLDASSRKKVAPAPPSKASKEQTGYVGLMNQGATCYMNSMLQSLFHLPAFRRLVFELPTTGMEDPEKSIPLNLQRLFCRLQMSEVACSTKALTTSLGWTSRETFVQHDVQEFERVLIDNLERKLEGTLLENSIASLFRGEYVNYIRCVNVPFQSLRKEVFYDLSMQVKGCASLIESFEKYIEPEEMNGANQYSTDEYGKQDAIMGTEFAALPSVLHLHLRRFEFDYSTMRMAKVNDNFAFPKELDLSKFVTDKSKSYLYDLFGVLVHSGGTYGGHYYAFLRTSQDPQWYKFNDSVVTKETEETAIDDNFGGKSYNAYMLIYVRHEDVEHLFEPVLDDSIPQHLRDYVVEIEKQEEEKRQELIKESMTAVISISTEDDLRENTRAGISGFKPQKEHTISMNKDTTLKVLYDKVATEFAVPVEQLRIWEAQYSRMPYRLIKPLDSATVSQTSYIFVQKSLKCLSTATMTDEEYALDPSQAMVFLKFFFQEEQQITFLSSCKVSITEPLSSLIAPVNKYLGLPEGTNLLIFQEALNAVNKRLENDATFKSLGIRHGAVLVLQLPVGEKFVGQLPSDVQNREVKPVEPVDGIVPVAFQDVFPDHRLQLVDEYLAATANMKYVDVYNYDSPSDAPLAILHVSPSLAFSDVKRMIAKLLSLDYQPENDTLLLYKGTDPAVLPTSHMDTSIYRTLKSYLQAPLSQGLPRHRLYFQLAHGISEEATANSAQFEVEFSSDGFTVDVAKRVLADKKATCREIFDRLGVSTSDDLRFMQVFNHSISSIMEPDQVFGSPSYSLRVDVVPADQRDPGAYAFLLPVSYGYVDSFLSTRAKGTPFLFTVIRDEPFSATRARLIEAASITDATFRLRKDARLPGQETPLQDDAVLSELVSTSSILFVLRKDDSRPPPSDKTHTSAPAVKIYN